MMIGCAAAIDLLVMTNVFALLRLLSVSDRDKGVGILALRHQVTVLQRQLGTNRPRFSPAGPGHSWPPCCTASHTTCSAGSDC